MMTKEDYEALYALAYGEVGMLNARIRWLLGNYNLWSPEGTFTFPDGDTWHK
jgi:hypothetical protein